MKIALGADHRGASSARQVAERLRAQGHEIVPFSDFSGETCDYPIQAHRVGKAVAAGETDMGVLICGTGVGMCIAANKVRGVRAAVVHDELTTELSRSHNDANIVCLSADLLGQRLIEKLVEIFLGTPFTGGRHSRRLEEIAAMERGADPATVHSGENG